jgi:hypothetical protein
MNDSEVGRTLAATAFSRIRANILGSRLLPDARLRFEPLRITYRVGLSPLREALSRWVLSGLSPPRGNAVFAWRRLLSMTSATSPMCAPLLNAWRLASRSSAETTSGRPMP